MRQYAPTFPQQQQPDVLQQMTSVANLIQAMDRRREVRALEYAPVRPSARITTLRDEAHLQPPHPAQEI